MRRDIRLYWLISGIVLLLTGCDKATTDTDTQGTSTDPLEQDLTDINEGSGEPFDDAEIFFELNTTANDLGFQLFLDSEGWRKVMVSAPGRRNIVQILAQGQLANLGITELRFESAEPEPAEVLAQFPPGEYLFRGRTVEGENLFSRANLSHDFIPAFTFSPSNGQLVDRNNTVVQWNIAGAEQVEIIIESDELAHVFDVTVLGSVTSLTVPPQFLAPGTLFKIEVLAIAENGNRTIVESTFSTLP